MIRMMIAASAVLTATCAFGAVEKSDTVMVPRLDAKEAAVSLAGRWTVARWPFKVAEADLVSPTCNDASWEKKQQPGKIFYWDPAMDKARPKNYSRVTLAHIDPEDGAIIRRSVKIPAAWAGKRVFLRFDAVYPAAAHFLNGQKLGEHMSGLTPVQYDVTGLVKPGEDALVAVRLYRRHKFSQLDMTRHSLEFCGLAQDARFFAVEPTYVADYHLVSSLSEDLKTGTVEGTVYVRNASDKASSGRLTVTLGKRSGQKGKGTVSQDVAFECAAGQQVALSVKLALEKPLLWNDEKPNLYAVTLQLAPQGGSEQVVSYKTGFRRFDFSRAKGALLNGNPVKFRGVNHLTFSPDGGLYTSKEFLRRSMTLMKKANVNCIRTHYAGPDALQDLCDEMGFYLMQELPIDWGTHFIHLDEWIPPSLMRIEALVRRDRHHACIAAWSVGNENMPETNAVADKGWDHLQQFEDLCHRLDPAHDTMFPPPGPANAIKAILELRYGEIADTHYCFEFAREFAKTGKVKNPNSWEAMNKPDDPKSFYEITADEAEKRGWKGVWFSSEWGIYNNMPDILHAPYGNLIADVKADILSGRNTMDELQSKLDREWGFMRDDRNCLGGAYFPWLCCGAGEGGKDANPWGYISWGESADWGVVTADLLPKPTWWVLRKAYSPVALPKILFVKPGATNVTFRTHNFYNSIDLKDCELRVHRSSGNTWMSMMDCYTVVPMSCKPGEDCEITIPLTKGQVAAIKKTDDRNGFAFIKMWILDPKGFRPILEDLFVFPETRRAEFEGGGSGVPAVKAVQDFMPIGPDGEKQ